MILIQNLGIENAAYYSANKKAMNRPFETQLAAGS